MVKRKIFAVSLIFLLVFSLFCNISAYAATDEHIERIFAKFAANQAFMTSIYEAGKLYADIGVDNAYIDNCFKGIIEYTIDAAVKIRRNEPDVDRIEFVSRIKDETRQMYTSLDSFFLSVIIAAFPEGTISDLMAEKMPTALVPLYNHVLTETQILLFDEDIALTDDYRFLDIKYHSWAKEAIVSLANAGVIDGVDSFNFEPSGNITREQFVKLLAVICDLDLENTISVFWDVQGSSWYHPYVTAMADKGYVNGIAAGQFGTGAFITRQDMAVLLQRIGEKEGKLTKNSDTHTFVDNNDISDYAKDGVNLLYSNSIITGTPENYFNPKNPATRAEAAQMLYKFYKLY